MNLYENSKKVIVFLLLTASLPGMANTEVKNIELYAHDFNKSSLYTSWESYKAKNPPISINAIPRDEVFQLSFSRFISPKGCDSSDSCSFLSKANAVGLSIYSKNYKQIVSFLECSLGSEVVVPEYVNSGLILSIELRSDSSCNVNRIQSISDAYSNESHRILELQKIRVVKEYFQTALVNDEEKIVYNFKEQENSGFNLITNQVRPSLEVLQEVDFNSYTIGEFNAKGIKLKFKKEIIPSIDLNGINLSEIKNESTSLNPIDADTTQLVINIGKYELDSYGRRKENSNIKLK